MKEQKQKNPAAVALGSIKTPARAEASRRNLEKARAARSMKATTRKKGKA